MREVQRPVDVVHRTAQGRATSSRLNGCPADGAESFVRGACGGRRVESATTSTARLPSNACLEGISASFRRPRRTDRGNGPTSLRRPPLSRIRWPHGALLRKANAICQRTHSNETASGARVTLPLGYRATPILDPLQGRHVVCFKRWRSARREASRQLRLAADRHDQAGSLALTSERPDGLPSVARGPTTTTIATSTTVGCLKNGQLVTAVGMGGDGSHGGRRVDRRGAGGANHLAKRGRHSQCPYRRDKESGYRREFARIEALGYLD